MKISTRSALVFLLLILTSSGFAQKNEFGAVGSYWIYSYEPHNGGPFGTTMLSVEKDTILNGQPYKILQEINYYQTFTGQVYTYTLNHFMRISNDSVFVGNQLIMDWGMVKNDSFSIYINSVNSLEIKVDSLSQDTINGVSYQIWQGKKTCGGFMPTASEWPVTIVESIGPINEEYLLWNVDGCMLGGGTNTFQCYKNGSFTYPPNANCERFVLPTSIDEPFVEQVDIFPNPAHNTLTIRSESNNISEVSVSTFTGQHLLKKTTK